MIKRYYRLGIYTEENLGTFVAAGYITEQEKQEITEV